MDQSLVSIILPVYNVAPYVLICVNSILNQTYTNMEVIIIDDASTDDTYFLLSQIKDTRISLKKNEINRGLAACVNAAIVSSKGKYVARMDGDDISAPDRIQKQVLFLEHHPDVDIVGTAMKSFGYSKYLHVFPVSHEECKTQLLFNVCFGHPTVMMKKSIFDNSINFYNEELRQYSEEYELWTRLVDKFRFANQEESLLMYRTFSSSSRIEAENKRRLNSFEIRNKFILSQLGVSSEFSLRLHDKLSNLQKMDRQELEQCKGWLGELREVNFEKRNFDVFFLDKELSKRFFELMYWNSQHGLKSIKDYYLSASWLRTFKPSIKQHLAFVLRSLLSMK